MRYFLLAIFFLFSCASKPKLMPKQDSFIDGCKTGILVFLVQITKQNIHPNDVVSIESACYDLFRSEYLHGKKI